MTENLHNKSGNFDWLLLDRLDAVWWGGAFIWGAITLLAENTGWADAGDWWNGWGVFFTGVGMLALVLAVIRVRAPAYRPKWIFSTVFGFIFIAIGLSSWEAGWWIWVVVLMIMGIGILTSSFARST